MRPTYDIDRAVRAVSCSITTSPTMSATAEMKPVIGLFSYEKRVEIPRILMQE